LDVGTLLGALDAGTWLGADTVESGGPALGVDAVLALGEVGLTAGMLAVAEDAVSGEEHDATTTTATPATSRDGGTIFVLRLRVRT